MQIWTSQTEIHKVKSERVPDAELLYLLSIEPGCVNLLAGQYGHETESAIQLQCPEFLLGFYFVGPTD